MDMLHLMVSCGLTFLKRTKILMTHCLKYLNCFYKIGGVVVTLDVLISLLVLEVFYYFYGLQDASWGKWMAFLLGTLLVKKETSRRGHNLYDWEIT